LEKKDISEEYYLNAFDHILDKVQKSFKMMPLADVITSDDDSEAETVVSLEINPFPASVLDQSVNWYSCEDFPGMTTQYQTI